jgi:hypothetical protein
MLRHNLVLFGSALEELDAFDCAGVRKEDDSHHTIQAFDFIHI